MKNKNDIKTNTNSIILLNKISVPNITREIKEDLFKSSKSTETQIENNEECYIENTGYQRISFRTDLA